MALPPPPLVWPLPPFLITWSIDNLLLVENNLDNIIWKVKRPIEWFARLCLCRTPPGDKWLMFQNLNTFLMFTFCDEKLSVRLFHGETTPHFGVMIFSFVLKGPFQLKTSKKCVQKFVSRTKANICSLRGHMRLCRDNQDHPGPYGTMQDHMGPYRTIRDHMRI